jgi:hypothetical protein
MSVQSSCAAGGVSASASAARSFDSAIQSVGGAGTGGGGGGGTPESSFFDAGFFAAARLLWRRFDQLALRLFRRPRHHPMRDDIERFLLLHLHEARRIAVGLRMDIQDVVGSGLTLRGKPGRFVGQFAQTNHLRGVEQLVVVGPALNAFSVRTLYQSRRWPMISTRSP